MTELDQQYKELFLEAIDSWEPLSGILTTGYLDGLYYNWFRSPDGRIATIDSYLIWVRIRFYIWDNSKDRGYSRVHELNLKFREAWGLRNLAKARFDAADEAAHRDYREKTEELSKSYLEK